MLKKITVLSLVLILSGCAGIRFCAKDENPKKTGCKAWDPASISGAVSR